MRVALASLAVVLLASPLAPALPERETTTFGMASGFRDDLLFVSGAAELSASQVHDSVGFFRASATTIGGAEKVCWGAGPLADCAAAPAGATLSLRLAEGSSFGFDAPVPFGLDIEAAHGLGTFLDLGTTEGFDDRIEVGPATIVSLVEPDVEVRLPRLAGDQALGFTTLEEGSRVEVVGADGLVLHTMDGDDPPLTVEGSLRFPAAFDPQVVVLPFTEGARGGFKAADAAPAKAGLSQGRVDVLDDILRQSDFLDASAKQDPAAILGKGGALLGEMLNGALVQASVADDPESLGDVAFAKFDRLEVTAADGGSALDLDGSYSLVVGDFATDSGSLSDGMHGRPFPWWVWALVLAAAGVVAVRFAARKGPLPPPVPGTYRMVALAAAGVALVALVALWDWQVSATMGTSLFTTEARGAALGLLAAVELGTLALALLLVGLPAYLIVRHGLHLARQPDFAVLAPAASLLLTCASGLLLLPALVAWLVRLAA